MSTEEATKYSRRNRIIYFLGFTFLYTTILITLYVIDWSNIYYFIKDPAIVREELRIKNEVKNLLKSQAQFNILFKNAQSNQAEWDLYLPHRFARFVEFDKLLKATDKDKLSGLQMKLKMNRVKLKHYIKLVEKKKKSALELKKKEQTDALLIADKKVEAKNPPTLKKEVKEENTTDFEKGRNKFCSLFSEIKAYKKYWQKYAPNQYERFDAFSQSINTLDSSELQKKQVKIEMQIAKLQHYTRLVEKQINQSVLGNKFGRLELKSIVKNSKSKTMTVIESASIESEYAKFKQIPLFKADALAKSYQRLSSSFTKAFSSKLSSRQVDHLLKLRTDVEFRMAKAKKVSHSLFGLVAVEVDDTLLDRKLVKQAREAGYPLEVKNRIDMHFRFIPAGSFTMGSPKNEKGRDKDEKQHLVTLTRPFYIQTAEVSQGQFRFSKDTDPNSIAVVKIGLEDATAYCKKLNSSETLLVGEYNLPTEAQWEYACRAGTSGARYQADLEKIAYYNHEYSGKIGKRRLLLPNAWGLYDMLGNAKEICRDRFSVPFFFTSPPKSYQDGMVDPLENSGDKMVRRGGAWDSSASGVRAAAREVDDPYYKEWNTGFRLIRTLY